MLDAGLWLRHAELLREGEGKRKKFPCAALRPAAPLPPPLQLPHQPARPHPCPHCRLALAHKVPIITTIAGAKATAQVCA